MSQDTRKNPDNEMAISTETHVETVYSFKFSKRIDLTDVNAERKTFSVESLNIQYDIDTEGESHVEIRFTGQRYNGSGTRVDQRSRVTINAHGYPSDSDLALIRTAIENEVSYEHWSDIEAMGIPRIDRAATKEQLLKTVASEQ